MDDNDNLKLEYDAARANMGGDWRMPTKAEYQELLDNTESEYFQNYNNSGVGGRKFTSKTNGNSIFIPDSGYRAASSFYDRDLYGYAWTSSFCNIDNGLVWEFTHDYGRFGPRILADVCYLGNPVRGVL